MKTRGFWLGRQQMRWLIVLLALMPLVPTGILVRDLVKSGQDEREFAIAMQMEAEQVQLASIANRISRNQTGAPDPEELRRGLKRIFGEGSRIVIISPESAMEVAEWAGLPEPIIEAGISEGNYEDWKVLMGREFEAPYFLEEQIRNRWWLAIGVMGGVTLVATLIWWAVNRGLRVDELRNDLLATMAHEMKTPLSSMRVLLETLTEGTISGPEKQREYLDLIQRENRRLSRLTEDFLTFGRLESGTIRLKTEDVEVEAQVSGAIEELEPAFADVNAEIRTEIEPGLRIRADADSFFAVIHNLIENSLKYGGERPVIVVRGVRDGETVRVSVADSGPGIPPELRKSIFRRYFRVDRRLDEKGSGVGLGLAICQQLTRKMGGRIRAEAAEKNGRGLRVVVSLPAAAPLFHESVEEDGENLASNLEPDLRHAQGVDR